MPDFSDIWREYLETVKLDLQAELRYQDMIATGNALNRLRIVQNGKLKAELRGPDYIQNLIKGQGSKPKGIGRKFIRGIRSWMFHKGIEGSAYAIAKAIVEKGTSIKQGKKGIDVKPIIKENLPTALESMSKELILEFKSKVKLSSGR